MNFDFLNRGAMLAPMAGVTDMPFRVLCHETVSYTHLTLPTT